MTTEEAHALGPFTSRLAMHWLAEAPDELSREVTGTLAFIDISGFTALTERLARRGKVGAEQMTDIINSTFGQLLDEAYREGADLQKWGGDAVLLLFQGDGHAQRAARAAWAMRDRLARIGKFGSGSGSVTLRMSVGIHSGSFIFCLVGDPADHRELLLIGPDVSRTVEMESTAVADQIAVSSETATVLPASCVGEPAGTGFLLVDCPPSSTAPVQDKPPQAVDAALLVSADVRAHLLATHGEAEHRRVAVGFVKFTGIDAQLAEHGREQVASALDELVRAVQGAAQRDGITFLASDLDADGGKLILTAGAPLSRGNSEERMLRAARDIVDSGGAITIKIGVNHGAVFAGEFGPDYRRTYTVMGDAVNLAARLMAKATPGDVIASVSTLEASGASFEMEELEPFLVKGKTEPIHAARVGVLVGDHGWRRRRQVPDALADDPSDEASAVPGIAPISDPFVGRDTEVATIIAAIDRARGSTSPAAERGESYRRAIGMTGARNSRKPTDDRRIMERRLRARALSDRRHGDRRGGERRAPARRGPGRRVGRTSGTGTAFVVTGAPGMGLSRLLREATGAETVPVHVTAGDAYQSTTAYGPFRPLLRSILAAPRGSTPAEIAELLTAVTTEGAPDLVPWLPLIGLVMDVPIPMTPEVEALAEEFRRPRLESSVVRLLALLLDRACVVAIDDAHLLDEASASLLSAIQAAAASHPWVLITAGHETGEWLSGLEGASHERLRLGPLDEDASRQLVLAHLGDTALTPIDMRSVLDRAGGNPTFLMSLARSARSGLAVHDLPDSVESLIAQQIDSLPPAERTMLRMAAVFGTTFQASELDALAEARGLPPSAQSLERMGQFVSKEYGDRYRFDQALVREAAYEGLPFKVRKLLHGQAGDTIARSAADPTSVSELLSLHYAHAGRSRPAWEYSRIAGQRATAKFAFAEAETFYTRAVEAARRLRDITPEERSEDLLALRGVYDRVGRLEQALHATRLALKHLRGNTLRTADAMGDEAHLQKRLGRYSATLRTVRKALALLADDNSPSATTIRCDLKMIASGVLIHEGKMRDALAWAQDGATDADLADSPSPRADAAAMIFTASIMLGEPDRSFGERARQFYADAGDLRHEAEVLNNLAVLDWNEGNGVGALESFRKSAVLAEAYGDAFTAAATATNVGDVLVRLGRMHEAQEVLQEAMPTLRAIGVESFEQSARRSLAVAMAHDGHPHEAVAMLESIWSVQTRLGEQDELTETRIAQGVVALVSRDPAAALGFAVEAEHRAHEFEAEYLLSPILRVKGAALIDLDRLDEAELALAEGLEACPDAEFERGFLLFELGRLAARRGDSVVAADHRRAAADAWARLGYVGTSRYPLP